MRILVPNLILFTFLIFMGVSCSFNTIFSLKRVKRDGFNSTEGIKGNDGITMRTKMGVPEDVKEKNEPEAAALESNMSTFKEHVMSKGINSASSLVTFHTFFIIFLALIFAINSYKF
ncbi:hypothetical protein PVAND_005922 [Polypedilum vanderplanki]|uniref:Lipoprotein n=1 Tax=Polypedilum vanderplanki TaxID=319348 RepID=A0A9J6C1M2_POLVA|nr:hypothetical protein PVAND_005922 [Polypedilum vanderplanki]